jgi:hypothetical protein
LLILDGDSALPSDVRERILAGGDRALFASSRHASRAGGSYRSQWWVSHNAQGAISALGVYGQRVHIEPAAELALVRFGSYPLPSNLHTDAVHQAAFTLRAFEEKSTRQRSPQVRKDAVGPASAQAKALLYCSRCAQIWGSNGGGF